MHVERHPKLMELIALFRKRHPELITHVAPTSDGFTGYKGRRLLSILNKEKLERVLACMLDENEFLGPTGFARSRAITSSIRLCFMSGIRNTRCQYLPAESNTGMFGGNSNWRGPVWMPVNVLLIRALLNLYGFYGKDFKIQCPTGSGQYMTLFEVARGNLAPAGEYVPARRQRPAAGVRRDRQVPGRSALAGPDPVLRILPRRQRSRAGASHQTGWTGSIAALLDLFGRLDADVVELEREEVTARLVKEQVGGANIRRA